MSPFDRLYQTLEALRCSTCSGAGMIDGVDAFRERPCPDCRRTGFKDGKLPTVRPDPSDTRPTVMLVDPYGSKR